MQQMEAPKVITPLQSVQVNEGSPVLLQATIVGKPRPNVRLYFREIKVSSVVSFLVCLAQRWSTIECIDSSSYSL